MSGFRLAVDWTACDGHGVCAELLPEHVDLDEWGYPLVHDEIDDSSVTFARAAVRACPALALSLQPRSPR